MPRLPTFANLGFNDPRAVTPLPQYPSSDPAAAALVDAGKSAQQLGATAFGLAAEQKEKADKRNDAIADLDFTERFITLHSQIEKETDPANVLKLKEQYKGLLELSAQAHASPDRRLQWMAKNARAVLHANADADLKATTLQRERYRVDTMERLDRTGSAASSNPDGIDAAITAMEGVFDAEVAAGNFTPTAAYGAKRRLMENTVRGAIDNLITNKQFDKAQRLIDRHGQYIDTPQLEVLRRRLTGEVEQAEDIGVANWALGRGPAPAVRQPGVVPQVSSIGTHAGEAADELRKLGWSDAAIKGALANGMSEGGFDTPWAKSSVPGENSFGHWQYNKNGELPDYLANEGRANPQDSRAQARFLARRMEQLVPGFSKISDPKRATDLILTEFERPKVKNFSDRHQRLAKVEQLWGTTAQAAPATMTDAAPDTTDMVAVGDSIAAHLIRKANVGGKEYNFDRKADSTAVSGLGPAAIFDVITSLPEEQIRGKDVVLSSGASNAPNQLARVSEQIDLLKNRGARSVTLLGVGTAEKLAGVNEQLAKIAGEKGIPFAGPLRAVADDGIHSRDPKAEIAAIRGAAAPARQLPPEVQESEQRVNRSGLPPMREMYDRVWNTPGLSDERRQRIWNRVKSEYTAAEADALRSERLLEQQRKAQEEAIESEIVADAASPNPKWTAQSVMRDERLRPDTRMKMAGFLDRMAREDKDTNTYGAGFYNAFQDVHRPTGDPQKINSVDDLYGRVGKDGDLTLAGFEKLRNEIVSKRTPEGEAAAMLKKQFFDFAKKQISGEDPLWKLKDPKGEELYLKWLAQVLPAYEGGLKAGKNPAALVNPDSPDYLGKVVPMPIRTREQKYADMLGAEGALAPLGTGAKPGDPASYTTPDALREAVRTGAISYDAGVAEARKRGYIPAPLAAPIR